MSVLQTFGSMPKNKYIARLVDVCEGSDTSQSVVGSCVVACTGEEVCNLEATDASTILDLKQRIARVFRHLPFAATLLLEGLGLPV